MKLSVWVIKFRDTYKIVSVVYPCKYYLQIVSFILDQVGPRFQYPITGPQHMSHYSVLFIQIDIKIEIEMVWVAEAFLMEDKDLFIPQSQYHGCWWHVD